MKTVPHLRLEYELSEADIADCQPQSARQSLLLALLRKNLATVALVSASVGVSARLDLGRTALHVFLPGLALLLGYGAWMQWRVRNTRHRIELEVSPRGLGLRTADSDVLLPWSQVPELRRQERYLCFLTDPDDGIPVPRALFRDHEAEQRFIQLVQQCRKSPAPPAEAPECEIAFELRPADLLAASLDHARYHPENRLRFRIGALLMGVLPPVFTWSFVSPVIALLFGVLGLGAAVLLHRVASLRIARLFLGWNRELVGEQRLGVSPEGIEWWTPSRIIRGRWSDVEMLVTTPHFFLVYQNREIRFLIPRRAFPDEEAAAAFFRRVAGWRQQARGGRKT